MEPVDLAGARSLDRDDPPPGRRRGVLASVIALGAVALMVLVVLRWWRGGGARRSVRHLAEEGAVALADVIVDELLPAA
jgi:hypothetical protein